MYYCHYLVFYLFGYLTLLLYIFVMLDMKETLRLSRSVHLILHILNVVKSILRTVGCFFFYIYHHCTNILLLSEREHVMLWIRAVLSILSLLEREKTPIHVSFVQGTLQWEEMWTIRVKNTELHVNGKNVWTGN